MKAKYDLIKMAGWIAVAIGGLAASGLQINSQKRKSIKNLNSILPRKQIRSPEGLLIFVLYKLCSFERRHYEQICNKIY